MRKLTVPTLIMTGDEDEPCLIPAIFLKRTIVSSALTVLPNSGTRPTRTNIGPKRARSEAMRISHGGVMVKPTPTAGPLIAAMVGFFRLNMS